jgi:hypothetical protein
MERRCLTCGHGSPPDATFCVRCGTPLDEDTIGLHRKEMERELGHPPSTAAPPATEAVLIVVRGPGEGSKYLVDREVTTIGRDPANDMFLDDITVSRRHAEVRRRDDRFFVHDMGSLNGTYVHRIRVENTQLADGDEVQVGRYRLVFKAGGNRGVR